MKKFICTTLAILIFAVSFYIYNSNNQYSNEYAFTSIAADNMFEVVNEGDIITPVIHRDNDSGSLGYALSKSYFEPNTTASYQINMNYDDYQWTNSKGEKISDDTVDKVNKAIYASNFIFHHKLSDYNIDINDTLSLYDATQLTIISLVEGWTPDMLTKQAEILDNPEYNAMADNIYKLYTDMYIYANNPENPSFKTGTFLLNVSVDERMDDKTNISTADCTISDSNGTTYYRTPLLSLIPEQTAGTVWDGDYAYTYQVELINAPDNARIVNEKGDSQEIFSTKPGVGSDFYVEVPTDCEFEPFEVKVSTTTFCRMQPVLFNSDKANVPNIMTLGGINDYGTTSFYFNN